MGHEVFSLWKVTGELSLSLASELLCVLCALKATAGQDKTLVSLSVVNGID